MNDMWLLLGVSLLGMISLIGFFFTKTKGFGRFATSALLMQLVLFMSALLFVAGMFDSQTVGHIFFAIAGFAGGLFTGKDAVGDA
jgi:hypothetical protein